MTNLRIFVAVELPIMREGFRSLLSDQGRMSLVGAAVRGGLVCREIRALQPDVAIIDVEMPQLDSIKAIRFLSQECADTKVLVLTMHADIPQLQGIIDAGAHGYALKHGSCSELIQAIKIVAAGGIYIDPALVADLLAHKGKRASNHSQGAVELSKREMHVVRSVAEGHTNKEIARDLNISIKSVETYKSRSMSKLGLQGRADLVHYALNQGWLRPSDREER